MVSQQNIIAANLVVAIAAGIAVALRFISRSFQRLYGADDWLILAALPLSWAMSASTLVAVHYGLGVEIPLVPLANLKPFSQAYFATELLWAASMPLIKISILLLYIRIFGSLRYFRILAYVFGGFTLAWAIMVIFVCAFQCTPVAYQWDKTIEGGKCINSWLFFVIGSSMDVLVDFAILVLPMPAVWNLKLSLFHRISLIGIFCLGSLTCVFSLIRLIAVIQNQNNPDPTYSLGIVAIWSTAEPCLGILATCLPTLGPLMKKVWGKHTGDSMQASKSSSGNSSRFGSKFSNKGGRSLPSKSESDDNLIHESYIISGTKAYTSASAHATPNPTSESGHVGEAIPMHGIQVKTQTSWSVEA